MRILYSELRTDSYLQRILTVLTVLTSLSVLSVPVLYLLGVSFHQGYLRAFGLGDSLFPLSFEQALLQGFSFLVAKSDAIGLTILLLFFAAILFSQPKVKRWLSRRRARNYSENKSATIFVSLLFFMPVLLFLGYAAKCSYDSGQDMAVKRISSLKDLKDKTGNYVTFYSDLYPAGKDSRQIFCGQSHCAFWLGSETLILRHESIGRMEMHDLAVKGTLSDKAAQRPSP